MKKQVTRIFSVLALVAAVAGQAQERKVQPCLTYSAMEEVFKADPSARARYEAAQAEFLKEADNLHAKGAAFEYTVPVVFHVLHKGGPENVSDAYLQQALQWVNMDFDRTHSDVGSVANPFQGMFIDSDIKFMLAHKDPQGNCTNGIVHYYDDRTIWDRNGKLYYNSPLYAGITWNPSKYLNIIVVKEILDAQGGNDVVGYTFKPGSHGTGDTRDAVVIQGAFLNTFQNTRFLTHEIGHWLNLSHTFGDTNDPGQACGDDGVCDTPPTKGQLGGCPSSSGGNSCAGTATCGYSAGEYNAQNIMDYTDCHLNFTAGQTAKMRAALASSTSGRSNLWQSANLASTDVDGTGICAPRADFTSSSESYTVCAGQSLTFKEYSFNGTVDTYQWNATNAVVSSANTATTSILFTSMGPSTVQLTVSNSLGSHTKSKVVTVLDGTAQIIGPYGESFETGNLPANWSVTKPATSAGTWTHTWLAALDGGGSFYLEGSKLGANMQYALYTPIIDFANSPVKDFSFAYAYARKSSSTSDVLKVQASIDCGGSWMDMYVRSANQLANGSGGISTTAFVPTLTQWKVVAQNELQGWDQIKFSPHVIIRWLFIEGTTGNGNNFFLDAINIPGDVGMSEIRDQHRMRVFPNPSSGEVSVQLTVSSNSVVKTKVTDITGRTVIDLGAAELDPGTHTMNFNSQAQLAQGVYFLETEVNGSRMTEKIIIR